MSHGTGQCRNLTYLENAWDREQAYVWNMATGVAAFLILMFLLMHTELGLLNKLWAWYWRGFHLTNYLPTFGVSLRGSYLTYHFIFHAIWGLAKYTGENYTLLLHSVL